MLKIRMGLADDMKYAFKTKKTNVLLDCSMNEFEEELINRFGKLDSAKVGTIARSPAIKEFTIFTENMEFKIEVKEVNKITLETTMDMIAKKSGIRG